MCLIDDYVDEMRQVLRGPRQAKEDLLEEATDHLIDASAAYMEAGASAEEASVRAVAEFGPVAQVAPGYQEELSQTQAYRTSLAMLIGVGIQPLIWEGLWPQIGPAPATPVGAVQETVLQLCEGLGALSLVAGVLGLIASRAGGRIPVVRRNVVKATGVVGIVAPAGLSGVALGLTALSPDPSRFLQIATLSALMLFVMVPMAVIAHSARRCLQPA